MLQKIKKYRGILTLGLALTMIGGFFTMDVSASSRYYSTLRTQSTAHENYDDKFYLKTEYHVGTTAPWDDAYIYVEAGGRTGMNRVLYYSFGAPGQNPKVFQTSSHSILAGKQYVNLGYEIPGKDYGVGHGTAQVYPISGIGIDNINEFARLDIK